VLGTLVNLSLSIIIFLQNKKLISSLSVTFNQWFQLYPEFLKNPFYIAGESYAGVYVPTLSHEVVKGFVFGIVMILKLLVILIFLLLTNYFTGIHKGDKPTINFKVSNFYYIIAAFMGTANMVTKEIYIIMFKVLLYSCVRATWLAMVYATPSLMVTLLCHLHTEWL